MVYMPNLVGICLPGTFLAITCEEAVTMACVLAYMFKIVGSVCPWGCVSYIFNVATIFDQRYMSKICTLLLVAWLMAVTLNVANICVFILHKSP